MLKSEACFKTKKNIYKYHSNVSHTACYSILLHSAFVKANEMVLDNYVYFKDTECLCSAAVLK